MTLGKCSDEQRQQAPSQYMVSAFPTDTMLKTNQITIDPEFRALVPPMSADSLAHLEESIRTEGVRDNLTVWWDGTETILIDGHHRWDILNRLGQVPTDRFTEIDLPDREAATLWILQNQVGRRNLTLEQRTAMVAKIVVLRQQQSAVASKANLKQGDQIPEVPKTGTSGTKTIRAAAKEFSVPRAPLQTAVTTIKDNLPKPTVCDICKAPFESKGAMKDHWRKAHAEEMAKRKPVWISDRNPCVSGKRGFDSVEDLYAARVAEGKPQPVAYFNCRQCGKVHKDKRQDAGAHLKFYHPPEPMDAPPNLRSPAVESQAPPAAGCSTQTPLQSSTEAFYVIRRKSGGKFFQEGSGKTGRLTKFRHASRFDEDSLAELEEFAIEGIRYESDNLADRKRYTLRRDEWEWVKVQAKYELTVVKPSDVKDAA